MIIEVEDRLCKVAKQFLDVLGRLQRAAASGDAVHDVEETAWFGLIEVGREMIVAYIKQQEEELPRPKVIEQEGKKLRRLPKRRTIVAIMDGETKLRDLQELKLGRAIGILDIWHVTEYLWKLAHRFHSEGSDEAEAFVETYLRKLLEGRVRRVIGGIRQMATKRRLSKKRQEKVEQYLNYFAQRCEYMKYDEYLAAGYPIGSGVVVPVRVADIDVAEVRRERGNGVMNVHALPVPVEKPATRECVTEVMKTRQMPIVASSPRQLLP